MKNHVDSQLNKVKKLLLLLLPKSIHKITYLKTVVCTVQCTLLRTSVDLLLSMSELKNDTESILVQSTNYVSTNRFY